VSEGARAKVERMEISDARITEIVDRLTVLSQENLDVLRPIELRQKLGELQEACK
jgi:hypothetical protein